MLPGEEETEHKIQAQFLPENAEEKESQHSARCSLYASSVYIPHLTQGKLKHTDTLMVFSVLSYTENVEGASSGIWIPSTVIQWTLDKSLWVCLY